MILLMSIVTNGVFDAPAGFIVRLAAKPIRSARDAEALRRCAWEIGEERPGDHYTVPESYIGLASVGPHEGFAWWNLPLAWVDETQRLRGNAWHNCRLILRLYDVSYLTFNGFNAHSIQDHPLPGLSGQLFLKLARPGTYQIGEIGFLLASGEFIPGARSPSVHFSPDSPSSHGSQTALLVDRPVRIEEISDIWEQEKILRQRRRPQLRHPLRLASFALGSLALGQEDLPARFVAELSRGAAAQGHEVHVFVPASTGLAASRTIDGVQYHPLELPTAPTPTETAELFGKIGAERLQSLPAFDLLHLHEWMSGQVSREDSLPTILSLTSLETSRRNGTPPSPLSRAVEEAERKTAASASLVLAPHSLHDRAATELGLPADRVQPFPIEGRGLNEWESPLDFGRVKEEIGVGPIDRLILFVGPLEHAAGVDLLVEALPTLLQRYSNLRVAYAGAGAMHGALHHRAGQLSVGHAVRLLGHVERSQLTRLLRAAAALVLPSRCRVPQDDAVVDLARRAGRPVVTTNGGPAHVVRHEENGILTYDNPGSMVWAIDRILGDPGHADRMGQKGRRACNDAVLTWHEVVEHYLELCAARFPVLTCCNSNGSLVRATKHA
jgi:glycosyltransferase involved in cell wall biosynthesis